MKYIGFATLRPDFTSKLVRELAFGTPKFYIAPYDKINHGLVNMSSNCDVKSGLSIGKLFHNLNSHLFNCLSLFTVFGYGSRG